MALEQRYKTDEVARKDTKMAGNCDSDGEKCKCNSKIPPWIWLLPQYVKRSGGGREGLKIRLDCGARAAVFRVRGPLDLSAWGSGKGGGSGTRVSQCHGIFQSLCSGFIWCMWWKLKSPQLNISFGNSLSPKKYLWNRSPGPSPSASPGLGKCVLPSAFSFKRNSLKVKKRQNLSCFLEAPKFLHASLLCLFDDVKL